ncbi:MAG: cysteine desulfurase [Verrucomicrobia bacterium RIFCSPLOWO2_12_FULL_64_8]|nr:MAG: cysteine desulfurase [Verrucomicrobia bacterium RIFCSPLOWO2_12_FULL_64_8]
MAEKKRSSAPDWAALRADFPILHQKVNGHPLVYLDNAATTQKPRAVLAALARYYRRDNANVHRAIHELSQRATTAYEAARARTARFINAAAPEEIVFTRGTTESINLVAYSFTSRLRPGDAILATEMEHHSNLVPWQLLARRTGARLLFLPVTGGDEGRLDLDQLDPLLAQNVKLFAFTHISNSLGTINPAADLCAAARRHGVVSVVDAAQSAGHAPLDVQALGCDFLAFSGHKMAGPTGIGVLYGRRALLEALDPFQGGGEMIASVQYEGSTWNKVPHKFEAGTPDIAGAVGLHAAMDYLDSVGRPAIAAHDGNLARRAGEKLRQIPGLRLLGPPGDRGGLVAFVLPGVHAHDVVTFADQEGVALRGGHHCTQPLLRKLGAPATTRASFYLYNTPAEVERLAAVIRRAARFFGV